MAKKEGSGVQIVQEVVAGTKEKVSVHDGEKDDVKRPVVQSFMTKWQHSGMKSKNWKRSWNNEGWMEAPGSWRLWERFLN